MFNKTENFAVIKSSPQKLRTELDEIFKNDTDFFLETVNKKYLQKQILSISKSKYVSDRFIIWEPVGFKSCSVFYSNFLDGWYTLLFNLAMDYKEEIFNICLDEVENKGVMGFYYFKNGKERIARTLYDNKWTFFERGEMLPFEKKEYYKRRKIIERVNNEILNEYLQELDVDIKNKSFYNSNASFILGSYK